MISKQASCRFSDMTRERRQLWRPRIKAAQLLCCAGALVTALLSSATAQDIRGIEVCTAEKQMERRTGCLQSNVEFLQQALAKLARETQDKITVTARDLAAARAEIVTLKSTIEKLNKDLAQMKAQAEPAAKK
jgi:formate dehydrogenase assembly factor FdhD